MNQNADAYLCGIMIGDGFIGLYKPKSSGPKYQIGITLNRISDKAFCTDFIVPLLKKFTDKTIRLKERAEHGRLDVIIYSKDLFNYMKTQWSFPVGKKGQIKIPEHITNDETLFAKTISGIFATDGTVIFSKQHKRIPYYPRFEFCSISVPLLDQLEAYFKQREYKCSRWGIRLAINGFKSTRKFINEIGLINSSQRLRAASLVWLEHSSDSLNLSG